MGTESGRRALASLLLVALLLPSASAGTSLDLELVRVQMVDQHGTSCGLPACPVTVRGSEPGNVEVDGVQRIESIQVVFDFSLLRERVGLLALLPDQSVVVDGSDLYLPLPLYRTADALLDVAPLPSWSPVGVDVTEDHLSYWLATGSDRDRVTAPYANDSEIGLQYDGVSLYNALIVTNSTDNYAAQMHGDPCTYADVCTPAEVYEAYTAATPNARAGLEFREARVVTDPTLLPDPTGIVVRSGAAAPVVRAPQATPARLAPEPMHAVRLEALPLPDVPGGDDSLRVGDSGGPSAAIESQVANVGAPDPVGLWTLAATGAFVAAVLAAAAIALYSRFTSRDQALRSETRARLLTLIKAEPGLSGRELGARAGLSRNGAAHHVKILERMGLVRVERRHRRAFVFPIVGTQQVESTVVARLFENDPVAELVRREPGLSRAQIHERLAHVPHRTRNHKLRRLVEAGAIERRHEGFYARDA